MTIDFYGVPMSWGSGYDGTDFAPGALRDFGLAEKLKAFGLEAAWRGADIDSPTPNPTYDPKLDEAYRPVLEHSRLITKRLLTDLLTSQNFPVIIGGDHAAAMGVWSAIIAHHDAFEQFGLLWVDAHMDMHTPVSAAQGKWGGHYHGMPLAHLLGRGDRALCKLADTAPVLAPQHLCLFGIRSFEPAEWELAERLNVTVITMGEIHREGYEKSWQKALNIVQSAPKGFGLSLDLDSFDPSDAPAVGTPEKDGLKAHEMLPLFAKLNQQNCDLKALEISEFNPPRDVDDKTAALIEEVLKSLLR